MPGANVNTSEYSSALKTEYRTSLLVRAQPKLLHGRWAQQATISNFDDYELRKYGALSAVTTAISEGVTPSQQSAPSLTVTTIDPQYYGAWMRFTRRLDLEAWDPIVEEMVQILGEQSGLSVDTLVRNDVVDNATVDYANNQSARSDLDTTNDLISYADIVNQIAELEAQDARKVQGGSYVCIVHPYTWGQLMKDSDFITLLTREGGDAIRAGDGTFGGRIFNTIFFITSNARSYSSDVTVYTATFIGADSYGIVGIGNLMPDFGSMAGGPGFGNRTGMRTQPVDIIMNDLGSMGEDHLHQRGSIGWLAAHEEAVLNSSWIRRLEHAVAFSG